MTMKSYNENRIVLERETHKNLKNRQKLTII